MRILHLSDTHGKHHLLQNTTFVNASLMRKNKIVNQPFLLEM